MTFEVRVIAGRGKADLRFGNRHGNLRLVIIQQFAQLAHRLARHDHAGHAVGAFGQGRVDAGQTVAVGGHAAQHRAVFAGGDVHVDAVQVIAGLFGRDREFRLVEQPPQHRRGGREVRWNIPRSPSPGNLPSAAWPG